MKAGTDELCKGMQSPVREKKCVGVWESSIGSFLIQNTTDHKHLKQFNGNRLAQMKSTSVIWLEKLPMNAVSQPPQPLLFPVRAFSLHNLSLAAFTSFVVVSPGWTIGWSRLESW